MPRRFRATPTTVHPSLVPAPRPTLGDGVAPPSTHSRRRLPGGARIEERRLGHGSAELVLVGEIDAFDRGALIDTCTALVLEGARDIRVMGVGLDFVDLRVLDAFATIADHNRRLGGSFELVGLREPFAALWAQIDPQRSVLEDSVASGVDGRVVPLRRPGAGPAQESHRAEPAPDRGLASVAPAGPDRPGNGPILRIVATTPDDTPSARPA